MKTADRTTGHAPRLATWNARYYELPVERGPVVCSRWLQPPLLAQTTRRANYCPVVSQPSALPGQRRCRMPEPYNPTKPRDGNPHGLPCPPLVGRVFQVRGQRRCRMPVPYYPTKPRDGNPSVVFTGLRIRALVQEARRPSESPGANDEERALKRATTNYQSNAAR